MTPEQVSYGDAERALADARTAAWVEINSGYRTLARMDAALDNLIAAAQRVARAEREASLPTVAEVRARLKLPDLDALQSDV